MPAILSLTLLCVVLPENAAGKTDDMGKVRREQQTVRRKAKETAGKLDANKQKTALSLRELNTIAADIDRHERNIAMIERSVDDCDARLRLIGDSVRLSEQRLERLRGDYARAVRKMNARMASTDKLTFVLSSASVHEAYRRMRYLRQFAKWRDRRAELIHEELLALDSRRKEVEQLKKQREHRYAELQGAKSELEDERTRQNGVVAELRKEEGRLKALLEEQNRRAEALDKELDRLIRLEEQRAAERRRKEQERRLAEERRKAERQKELERKRNADAKKAGQAGGVRPNVPSPKAKDAAKTIQPVKQSGYDMSDDELALSGSFESNKGRLPYPISGKCRVVRPFGRQRHPELRHVMTDNGGIDIEAPKGAVARAVFDGKVSAVFSQEGYGMVVMVRHGRYLTIYVNLSEIYVAVDSKVKTGQAIGVVSADADGGSQSVLHFEVRREKVKLNPMDWLK